MLIPPKAKLLFAATVKRLSTGFPMTWFKGGK